VPAAALPGLLQAPYRSPLEAYDGFAERMDHVGTRRLIEAVAAHDPALAAELSERRAEHVRVAEAALRRRTDAVRAEFDELEAYPGGLDAAAVTFVQGLLLDAAHPEDDDLARAADLLDAAQATLAGARTALVESMTGTLAASGLDEETAAAVRHLLDHGALGAAHERLDAATRQRGVLDAARRSEYEDLQRRFWGADAFAAAASDGIFARAEEALAAGRPLEPFGPGPAEPQQREVNAAALRAWSSLFRDKRAVDFDGRLRSVLALLALDGPTPKKDPDSRMLGNHLAEDVVDARPVLPVVSHEFGSGAGGRYRVLVVWEPAGPDKLVSLALNDKRQGPHLVLYRGMLTRTQREALANATRDVTAAAHRIVVIDDAVVLTMAFRPVPNFAALEHLVLPFAYVSLFTPDVAGSVPPELFVGRRRELGEVLSPSGSSFVYGGRQVGKSALLIAARREVESAGDPDRRAVYLDVRGLGLGLWRDVNEFWLELLLELQRWGVLTERTSHAARGDAAVSHIRQWLEAGSLRRLLVLLDECDDFLDADARHDFAIIERLRNLMNVSDRRFKVVLAGLHQVQRFERQRNVPLVHLTQQPLNVGPLPPADAVELLQRPLLAIGYTLDEVATWRLLAQTNYQAGIIQASGQALVRALWLGRRRGNALPTPVDREFVDQLCGGAELGEQIRKRFMWTINLDDRYRCMAYVIALRNLQQGMQADYEDAELLAACASWWPAGFDGLRLVLFRDLISELIGLGVLVRVGDRVRIRTPNVIRLLGTRPHVEAELLDFENLEAAKGFEPSLYRRALPRGGRSPLTEEELASLVEVDAPGLALVGGSDALGIGTVAAAVAAKATGRPDIAVEYGVDPAQVAARLAGATGRTVLVSDARSLSTVDAYPVARQIQGAVAAMPHNTRMRRAVLVLGPGAYELWADTVPPPSGLEAALRLGLRRVTAPALEAWSSEESLDLDRQSRQLLLAGTGGWPVLLDRALQARRAEGWGRAADTTRQQALADGAFVEAALGGLPQVAAVAHLLADLGGPVTWEDITELSACLPECAGQPPASLRDAIGALQLTVERDDGTFELEPLLFEALRVRGAAGTP
jgi:hypothetical protein